jgi:signal transduction histidine kinase
MMTAMPIRWRLTLFHVLTVLGIGVLLVIGLFAVFGIAVSEAVEQQASSRANEAARIIESAGGLSDDDLASLSRDNVIVIALDERGAIEAQTGAGIPAGTTVPEDLWREVLASGEGKGGEHRGPLTPWDDSIRYLHAEPVEAPGSPIRVVQAVISYDYVGQTQFEIVTLLFAAIGILVIVLISIGSFFIVRVSLAPVTEIATAAAEITAVDLSRRLPVRSKRDELGRLAITFNELLERLEDAFRHREKALADQRRFVADASHELRTPLTSILGYARMLRSWGLAEPEAAREAVTALEGEAARMETLVDRLLQLARSDEGAPLRLEAHDLRGIVERAVQRARASATASSKSGITIQDEIPLEPVVVVCDAEQVSGVIDIVLDNATKFSPPNGEVMIRLSATSDASAAPGEAVITISDCGPGIAPADHEWIFQRFYRADASRTTRGTGLGLAIAHETLRRHGGSIGVESAPGHGAVFSIRLPRVTSNASELSDLV